MQLSEEGGCAGWGIDLQSGLSPHKRSTSVPPVVGSERLESSEHSDSQQ
jgi:hypothetical protein